MSISGNLSTIELADILQLLSQRRLTGTLEVDNGRVQRRIFFREGQIVASASSDPNEYLSHVLLTHGVISEEELGELLHQQARKRRPLGQILVEQSSFSERELRDLLQLKTEESIYDMLRWTEGAFQFHDRETLDTEVAELALDAAGVTLEGMHRVDEWQRIRPVIASSRCIPVALEGLDRLADSERERTVLNLVDDARNIEEICRLSRASEFFVSELLHRKVKEMQIKIVSPQLSATGSSPPLGLTGAPRIDANILISTAEQHLERGAYEFSLCYYRAAQSLDPENEEIRNQLAAAETRIQAFIEAEGVVPSAVPHLARSLETLSRAQLSPEAGFVLSRIDGSYDLGSILKITPMGSLDSGLLILRLIEAGHITLQGAPDTVTEG